MSYVKAPHLWIPKTLTKADTLKHAISFGRPMGKPVGTHMDELVALRKIVLLCSGCVYPFEYWKKGYRREEWECDGACDSCRKKFEKLRGFVPEENWQVAHGGDVSKPKKGRWGLSPKHPLSRVRLPTTLEMKKTLFGRG